mmetsp:Transcript_44174/g.106439  ORF Transcript_44174/g.106439 Transcript_44174/m.106439 type:complete len:283 (+) Transcript_44174:114-962(+)
MPQRYITFTIMNSHHSSILRPSYRATQQMIVTISFFFLLLVIISPTLAFHTPRISRSKTTASVLFYKPAAADKEESNNNSNDNNEETSSSSSDDQTQDNGDLFLSQMASNLNQKVEEAHPTMIVSSSKEDKLNMDDLDMKAKMKQWAGNYDQDAMRAKLQDRIDTNPVFLLIYGTCPYCAKLIDALRNYCESSNGKIKRRNMLIVDLDALGGLEKYALRTEVMELEKDHTTIPALWVGGQFIGGYQQVQALQQQQTSENEGKDQFQILLEQAMKMSGEASAQ